LYNTETTKMTPLDFRLIATAVFQLFSIHCSLAKTAVNDILSWYPNRTFVSPQVLSNASFNVQAKALTDTFTQMMVAFKSPLFIGQLVTFIVQLSGINSAVNTNAFQMSVPGSDQYQIVNKFYPLHGNASFSHVGHLLPSSMNR